MKILLAAVNAKYIHSNLAVYSLRAYAQPGGSAESGAAADGEISIAEYTINQQVDEILMDIYRRAPEVLCISCYLWNISWVEQMIAEIPKILPETEIWLGGPEVSYDAGEFLKAHPSVAGIMRGEGEETFRELAEFWRSAGDRGVDREELSRISGISYRDADGQIRENESRPPIDLSSVPFVYERIEDFKNRIIYYESSRGCPFSCSYCLSSIDKCLRFRDLELVKRELQFFIDHEVPQVKFVDRTFNCRHDHAMAVWKYIRDHDRGITNFHFEVAADLLNEEEIGLIRSMRPGLIQLEIGVQSANEQTIREIRRTMNLNRVQSVVARIRENGNVHQHLDLIAGLPWEDYESFGNSFDRVYAMRPEQLQLGFLKVLKGSLMYEKSKEYGLKYQERPPYEVLSTRWLDYGDVIRLKGIEEMVEIYYNSGQFRNTMEHLTEEFTSPFVMYEALAAYYEKSGLSGIQHSRIARYEILSSFITAEAGAEMSPEKKKAYTEWLTLDLYLRDNVKNRPAFLGESGVSSDEAAAFYKREENERVYLREYEGYDRRQMRRMTHLERIGGALVLFDYLTRDPLTGNARVCRIEESETPWE